MADAVAGTVVGPRANFGQRFAAMLVDSVILFVVSMVLGRVGTAGSLIAAVIGIGYYIYLEGSPSGQTVGKKVLNIRVVDAETASPIGYGRATLRYFAKIVSAIPCLLGFFWMLWDSNQQTWHDKISTNVVVPTDAYPVDAWPG